MGSAHHDTVASSIRRQLLGPGLRADWTHAVVAAGGVCDDLESSLAGANQHPQEDGEGRLQSEAEQDHRAAWAQALEAGGALDMVEYLEALMDLTLVPQAVSVDAAQHAFENLQSDFGASGKVDLDQFNHLLLILSLGSYDTDAAAKLLQAERDREQEQEQADAAAASALLWNDQIAQDEEKKQQRWDDVADTLLARSIAHQEQQHCDTGVRRAGSRTPPGKGGARSGQGQDARKRDDDEPAFWAQLGRGDRYLHIRYSDRY